MKPYRDMSKTIRRMRRVRLVFLVLKMGLVLAVGVATIVLSR